MRYVSVDIETSGHSPKKNSILSIGAAEAYIYENKEGPKFILEYGREFYINLDMPSDRGWDPDTKKWWSEQDVAAQKAWKIHPIHRPGGAICLFLDFLYPDAHKEDPEPVTLICYPASFDYRFLTYYVDQYVMGAVLRSLWFGRNTQVLCLHSMVMGLLPYHMVDLRRRNWPEKWLEKSDVGGQKHDALDDARVQLRYFVEMLDYRSEAFGYLRSPPSTEPKLKPDTHAGCKYCEGTVEDCSMCGDAADGQ